MWTPETCVAQISDTSSQINNDYVPPEKKQKESAENKALNEALECCKNQELGIEEASMLYGIPKGTLRAKLKNSNFSVIDEKYQVFVLHVFPPQAESDLVELLQSLISSQISFSSVEVRRLGYELVSEKYKISNLPQEKNCLLGQRWYKRFISKYPHLNVEHPAFRVHQEIPSSFYNALEDFVLKHGIDSAHIYSVDVIELKFRASSVDDLKIFHRRKTIYTDAKAVCCTNPTGIYIPPVFIKPHEHCGSESNKEIIDFVEENEILNFSGCEGASNNLTKSHLGTVCDKLKELCRSNMNNFPSSEDLANIQKQIKVHLNKKLQPMSEENGEELREKLFEQFSHLRNQLISKYENTLNEVTSEIFFDWFSDFIKHTKSNPQKKILLLLSDQTYVKCFRTLELAKESGVIFLVLPPHSSHKIHPLDGFAMSLNRNLSTCARRWLGKNPDFKVQQIPLHALFKKAYSETINPMIARNGFLYSGVWPINRNIFESSELGGESVLLQKNTHLMPGGSCLKATVESKSERNFALPGINGESDLKKLCRICMKEKMYMKPLFESPPSLAPNYHGKKISEITSMPISWGDGLPKCVCQYCLVQLMDAIKIRTMAVESHQKQVKLREAIDRLYFEEEEDDESEEKRLLSYFQYETSQPSHKKIMNKLLSKNFDMNSICRICMGEKPLMISIFFKPQDGNTFCADICRKIMEVSRCQVHIHDGLSSFICPFCRASVNQASEFIQKLLSSDKRFREIVAQLNSCAQKLVPAEY